jgi:hypothetical protein
MEIPHGEQTFGVRSWQDMFQKLCFELDEFEVTRGTDRNMAARGYRALNLAWTTWHIHDWFFEGRMDAGDYNLDVVRPVFPDVIFVTNKDKIFDLDKDKPARLALLGNALADRFEALKICRTLATAGKHGKAERKPMATLTAREVEPIEWMPPGPNGPIYFDVRVLVGKTPWDARDLFQQAKADWRQFFTQIGEVVPDTGAVRWA